MIPLDDLAAEAAGCTRCALHVGRTHVVFGSGSAEARLLVVGEAPGAREDETGEPFVGRSGALLSALLEEAGLPRSGVYITNIVKCRPPGNRNPRADEMASCSPYLAAQLDLIEPSVVVTLGNFATRHVLQTKEGITGLRGKAYPWAGRTVVPTYHPAAALRQGSTVREALRADLVLAKSLIRENV